MDELITNGPLQVDYITAGPGGSIVSHGSAAQRLLSSGMRPSSLRTLDILRKEEWLLYDTTVIDISRQRLVGVGDLMDRGLRFDLQNGLGTIQIQWETVSDITPAEVTMSGMTEIERDRAVFSLKTMPVPIVHKDFSLNLRVLEASRRRGEPLDTTMAALAARVVAEKIENMLFKGSTITVGGQAIEGYTNATGRNTGNLLDWSVVGSTGVLIVTDILKMMAALVADHMYGPYMLYVPLSYYVKLANDYTANYPNTILSRILQIPGIAGVKMSENLGDGGTGVGEVVLVQMTRDVIDEVVGMQPTTIMWEEKGGMMINFKVMAIMVPRVKSDFIGQSGIAHYKVP